MMTPTPILHAVIVDDERLARASLRSLLADHPDVAVVGEADTVRSARRLILDHRPDVAFLDICLAGESSFDAMTELSASVRVVFVTGYAEYATRAFRVGAIDYLLKPVDPAHLTEALDRIRRLVGREPEDPPLDAEDTIFLRLGGRYQFVRVRAIRCITADGPYSRVAMDDGRKGIASPALKEWEERLPGRLFVRVHRSALVNLEHVDRVEPNGDHSYLLHMKGGCEPLPMSHRCFTRIRTLMG